MRSELKSALRRALAVSIMGLASVASANAAVVLCSGTVNSIALQPNGGILVSYGNVGGVHVICNVSTTYFEFDKDACKAWFATIQTAKAQQRTIRIYYDSATPGNPTSCTSIVYGQNTRPYFMETLD